MRNSGETSVGGDDEAVGLDMAMRVCGEAVCGGDVE